MTGDGFFVATVNRNSLTGGGSDFDVAPTGRPTRETGCSAREMHCRVHPHNDLACSVGGYKHRLRAVPTLPLDAGDVNQQRIQNAGWQLVESAAVLDFPGALLRTCVHRCFDTGGCPFDQPSQGASGVPHDGR